MRHNFLVANWENLLVATFETEKKLLEKFLPPKTELNDWHGRYFMSLVGFMFSHARIMGIPSPFYRSFEELNLRFYVKHKEKTGWKNGVVFIKEIVPSKLIGVVGKLLYCENFISLPMHHSFYTGSNCMHIEYHWQLKKKANYIKLRSALLPDISASDTLESFIRDHYKAYTKKNNVSALQFDIRHKPWKIYPGLSFDMELDAATLYGSEFTDSFKQKPVSIFLMDGSRTSVSQPCLL